MIVHVAGRRHDAHRIAERNEVILAVVAAVPCRVDYDGVAAHQRNRGGRLFRRLDVLQIGQGSGMNKKGNAERVAGIVHIGLPAQPRAVVL